MTVYFKDSMFKYCVYKGKKCIARFFKTRIEAQNYIDNLQGEKR